MELGWIVHIAFDPFLVTLNPLLDYKAIIWWEPLRWEFTIPCYFSYLRSATRLSSLG